MGDGLVSPMDISHAENLEVLDPETKDGKLVFKDWSHVDAYSARQFQLPREQRLAWEESRAFKSVLTVYEDFEEISLRSSETGYGVSLETLKESYPSLRFDAEGDYEMDVWSIPYAAVVNAQRFFQVGETLVFFSRHKMVQGPVNLEGFMERAASIEVSDSLAGIRVEFRDADVPVSRLRCRNYEGFAGIPGIVTTLFSNAWLFQDADAPNGAHEWKHETLYEATRANSSTNPPCAIRIFMRVKYRKRGAFGIWYAYTPRSHSSIGTSDMVADGGLIVTNAAHARNGQNVFCCATWTDYIYSDLAGDNPITNPPDLVCDNRWDTDCFDFVQRMEVQDGDGVWRFHQVAF